MQTSFSQQEYLAARAKMAELRAKGSSNAQTRAGENEYNMTDVIETAAQSPSTSRKTERSAIGVSMGENYDEAEESRESSALGLGTAKSEHAMMATAAATEAHNASRAASAAESSFEAAASAFERSIRTAGLRRGRENAFVEEAETLAELSRSHAAAAESRGATSARADAHTRAVAAFRQAQHETEVQVAQATADAAEAAQREAEERIQAANARLCERVNYFSNGIV